MKSVDESIVEQASLEWLAGLGYASVHGDDLSPGGQHEARLLVGRLTHRRCYFCPAR